MLFGKSKPSCASWGLTLLHLVLLRSFHLYTILMSFLWNTDLITTRTGKAREKRSESLPVMAANVGAGDFKL